MSMNIINHRPLKAKNCKALFFSFSKYKYTGYPKRRIPLINAENTNNNNTEVTPKAVGTFGKYLSAPSITRLTPKTYKIRKTCENKLLKTTHLNFIEFNIF
jgi:hypothetical protein